MNEPRGTPRRETSDFSIEKILAKDSPSSSLIKEPIIVTNFLQQDIHTDSNFVAQNKLDWLRNVYRLQPSRSTIDSGASETNVDSGNDSNFKQNDNANPTHFNGEELSWLQCTRYRPPKLPRKSSAGKSLKRKLGSHPRIPFTKYQVEVLEEKYKNNAYLSRKDVVQLSDLLDLPQNRIKIWFQNRRARERRESQSLTRT